MQEFMPFLEQLALKLGTTVEKLWEVLLKQAPISGLIDGIISVGLIIAVILSFKFVQRKTTAPPKTKEDYHDPKSPWDNEGAIIAWIVFGAFSFFVGLFLIFAIGNIVTAFLNPNYWALKELSGFFKKIIQTCIIRRTR
jgi:hypothetical protein